MLRPSPEAAEDKLGAVFCHLQLAGAVAPRGPAVGVIPITLNEADDSSSPTGKFIPAPPKTKSHGGVVDYV